MGAMGCLTGNYLLIRGDYESRDIVELMRQTFRFVAEFEGEIPCRAARLWQLAAPRPADGTPRSKKYLTEVLEGIKDENLTYP